MDDSVLDMSDDDPAAKMTLDPDEFVAFLKHLDPHKWDPLPCNIT